MAIHFTDDKGIVRALGNVERPEGLLRAWPEWGASDTIPLIPRPELIERIKAFEPGPDAPFLPPVADQGQVGCCNASATATVLEACRMRQGLPPVQLSAGDLYGRICGGRDQGSTLEDGLHEAVTNGIASTKTVPYLDWRGSHPQAAQERPRYRGLEFFLCPSGDHVLSALVCGYYGVVGCLWKSEYRPGPDGWLPPGTNVVGGHAIMAYKPAVRGSQLGLWCQNSWRPTWGLGGRFVLPVEALGRSVGGFWVCRDVVDEGGILPAPPA